MFSQYNFSIIANAHKRLGKNPVEILFDEWGTTGKIKIFFFFGGGVLNLINTLSWKTKEEYNNELFENLQIFGITFGSPEIRKRYIFSIFADHMR